MTHCTLAADAPRSRSIDGRATMTMLTSSRVMNAAIRLTVSAFHRPGSCPRPAGPVPARPWLIVASLRMPPRFALRRPRVVSASGHLRCRPAGILRWLLAATGSVDRELDQQAGALAGGAPDAEGAAGGLHPVPEADEPGAAAGVGAANAVVADAGPDQPVVGIWLGLDPRGGGGG